MDYDRFRPDIRRTEQKPVTYKEPPVKDYSYLLDTQLPPSEQPPVKAKAKKSKHHGRLAVITMLVLLLLAAGGYGAYRYTNRKAAVTPKTTTAATQAQKPAAASTSKVATTSYNSPNFNVTLNYPAGWTVAGDTVSLLTIESPSMSLPSASGQAATGKIIMNIQPKGKLPSAFGTADAEAVLDSQHVSYSQPTATQRAQTYLSFVQYASTTTLGALDGIYITGDFGYQKDQTILRTDIANFDPLVTVTFGKCADTACTSLTPINITASSWNDTSFSAPILTLIKSLAFN